MITPSLIGVIASATSIVEAPPALFIEDYEEDFNFDPAYTSAGHTLTNANKTLENTSGGTDYRRFVPSEQEIPKDTGRYFEIECLTTATADYNGYMGVMTDNLRDSVSLGPTSGNNPVDLGSLGYRGTGDIWGDDTLELVTGVGTFGTGDILMFFVDMEAREFYVGKNGTWHRDPDSARPSRLFQYGYEGGAYYVTGQGRDQTEGGTLISKEADFNYTPPARALPLGRIYAPAQRVESHTAYVITQDGSFL